MTFLGSGRLLTTGFSRHSDRQYSIWDQDDLAQPLATDTIDSSSGVVFPFYDYDTNIVFLAGKGDGNIRYYEIADEAPFLHFLNQFISGNPQRGLGVMPKRGVSTSQCEIFRFYKLHATKGICEPISMIVPRKSDQFHDDLYPDTAAPRPALSAQEWIQGCNAYPLLMSMKTGERFVYFKLQRYCNYVSIIGGNVSTYKPRVTKTKTPIIPSLENNKKKFAFLSVETVPDYRPKEIISEKTQKTTTNQSTKFHQLQQMFGSLTSNNEVTADIPLYKQLNTLADNINTENEVSCNLD